MELRYDLEGIKEAYPRVKRISNFLEEAYISLRTSLCPNGFQGAVMLRKATSDLEKLKDKINKVATELEEVVKDLEYCERVSFQSEDELQYEFAIYGFDKMSDLQIVKLINGEQGSMGNNIWNQNSSVASTGENIKKAYEEMTYNTAIIISAWCKKQGYSITKNDNATSLSTKYIVKDSLGNTKSVQNLIEEVRNVYSKNSGFENVEIKNINEKFPDLLYEQMNYSQVANTANAELPVKIEMVNRASSDYFQRLFEETGIDKRQEATVDMTRAIVFPSYEDFVDAATNGQGVAAGIKINGYYKASTGYIYLPPDVSSGTIYHEWVGHATGTMMLNNATVEMNGYNYVGLNEAATQAMAIKAGLGDHETAYDSVSYLLINIEKAMENSGKAARIMDVAYYGEDKRYMQKIVDQVATENKIIPKGSFYVLLAKSSYKIIKDPYMSIEEKNAQIDYLERYVDSLCRSVDPTYDTWKYEVPRV